MFSWINRSLASIDIKHDAFYNETSLFENDQIWQVLDESAGEWPHIRVGALGRRWTKQ